MKLYMFRAVSLPIISSPDDGQRNCPKNVVSCQNKFGKLVYLVGFIIKKVPFFLDH
jgi:hypothetical protein